MMTLLLILLWLWLFWVFYVAVINLYRINKVQKIRGIAGILAYFTLLVGATMDFITNMVLTIVFLDPPREFLVTQRLIRYKAQTGWRTNFANLICQQLLNRFDPSGDHCK